MKNNNSAGITAGLMIALGIPAIVWAFFDWKWALVVFVVGQLLLSFSQLVTKKRN